VIIQELIFDENGKLKVPPEPSGTLQVRVELPSPAHPNGRAIFYTDLAEIPPAVYDPPSPIPFWPEFRRKFLALPSIIALRRSHPGEFACVMPALIVDAPDVAIIKILWNDLIAVAADQSANVPEWQQSANEHNLLGLVFNPDGTLQ